MAGLRRSLPNELPPQVTGSIRRKGQIAEVTRLLLNARLSRRGVIARLAMLGISSSAIATTLAGAGLRLARAAAPPRRGASGVLKLLVGGGFTIVNPHLAGNITDFTVSRVCLEPLLTVNATGLFTPVLAAEVPSRQNGGVAADGRSVTYKLKQGVKWADGRPFTADDVIFTFQFIINKQSAATTYASYANVAKVEAPDPWTVKITFKVPTPAWYLPFVGRQGMILPRHTLDAYLGNNARYAPFNTKAFGTGPYKVETFRPADLMVCSINEYYRNPDKPAFSQLQIKGGGDAASDARAVLETGEYDYAWNLLLEWPVLESMMKGGKGVVFTGVGGGVEQICCNMTDPNKEIDGQRSSIKAPHPFLTDMKVRRAMGMAIDRETIAKQLYGQGGVATPNVLTIPTRLNSKNTKTIFDIDKANQLLDEAGWQRGPDGIRSKGGVKLQVTLATNTDTRRQKTAQIVKDGWGKLGITVTLKPVVGSTFFSSSPGNNDTYAHFYTDVEMLAFFPSLFPTAYMALFYSGDPAMDIAQKENNWSGRNFFRWVNKEYNQLFDQAQAELDPKKNDELWIKLNDLVVSEGVSLPIIDRRVVSTRSSTLEVGANQSPFDTELRNIADWRRIG